MRTVTLTGIAAIIISLLAVIAAFYAPHPSLNLGQRPQGIVTYGMMGDIPSDKARELLGGPPSFMTESSQGISESPIPSVIVPKREDIAPAENEGDILKVAPPYALYVSKGNIYLLKLWPATEMNVIDWVDLTETTASLTGVQHPTLDIVRVLVINDTALVTISYRKGLWPSYNCSTSEKSTTTIKVGNADYVFTAPRCRVTYRQGTLILAYEFGDEGLSELWYHVIEGMDLIDSVTDGRTAYYLLKPVLLISLSGEIIDGVDILRAGPIYVIGKARPTGETLITLIAANVRTGKVGVTNLIIPLQSLAYGVSAYTGTAPGDLYILIGGSPTAPEEKLAKVVASCADKAPEGLREKLKPLGKEPAPADVLVAVKEWLEDFTNSLKPIVEWVHELTSGNMAYLLTPMILANARVPAEVNETLYHLISVGEQSYRFCECVYNAQIDVPSGETRIVKLGFSGLVGQPIASIKIPGRVPSPNAFAVVGEESVVVTTLEKGATVPVFAPYYLWSLRHSINDKEELIPQLVMSVFMTAHIQDIVDSADTLADIFVVIYNGEEAINSSIYSLSTTDLSIRGSLTGIAPGESITAVGIGQGRAYVVAGNNFSTLYTIDLSDPASPVLAGEARLRRTYNFIMPMDEDKLVCVGYGQGWLRADLYIVGDPSSPALEGTAEAVDWLPALTMGRGVQVLSNNMIALPVKRPGSGAGIAVITASTDISLGVVEVRYPVRAAVIDETVYAFGAEEVVASSLPDLVAVSRVTLPAG